MPAASRQSTLPFTAALARSRTHGPTAVPRDDRPRAVNDPLALGLAATARAERTRRVAALRWQAKLVGYGSVALATALVIATFFMPEKAVTRTWVDAGWWHDLARVSVVLRGLALLCVALGLAWRQALHAAADGEVGRG